MVVKLIWSLDQTVYIRGGDLVRAGQWRFEWRRRLKARSKTVHPKRKTVGAMRCGGDGLKHRSCQREQCHGTAWYGSTIPSRDHDTVYHGTAWYDGTIPSPVHDAVGWCWWRRQVAVQPKARSKVGPFRENSVRGNWINDMIRFLRSTCTNMLNYSC